MDLQIVQTASLDKEYPIIHTTNTNGSQFTNEQNPNDQYSQAPSAINALTAVEIAFKLQTNIEKSKLQPKQPSNLDSKPNDSFGLPEISIQV